jgi:hypothetical protein
MDIELTEVRRLLDGVLHPDLFGKITEFRLHQAAQY